MESESTQQGEFPDGDQITNATDLEFLLGKGKYDTESIWSALKKVFGEYVIKEDISRCTEDQWKQIGLSLGVQNALKSWASSSQYVKYGDRIRLIHVNTKKALHSHAINYKHSGSSGQQQVTCFGGNDSNDLWIVCIGSLINSEEPANQKIKNGSIVALRHLITGAKLHSHSGFPSPITKQQEVTCFQGEDTNNNWRLECASCWKKGEQIRLIHVNTNHALHSHVDQMLKVDRGDYQQETTAFQARDSNDLWYAIDAE